MTDLKLAPEPVDESDVVRPVIEDARTAMDLELPAEVAASLLADPYGWTPPSGLDVEQWSDLFLIGKATERALKWVLGDMYNYGKKFGERRSAALDAHDLADGTISNLGYVAEQYPRDTRDLFDERLISWTHYRIAAPFDTLDERLKMLERAQRNAWSTRDMIREVKKLQDDGEPIEAQVDDELPEISEPELEDNEPTGHTEMMSWRVSAADAGKSKQIKKILQAKLQELADEMGITFLP